MVVLDASVILKWVLPPEPGTTEAVALRSRHITGEDRIAVPALLYYEAANALARTSRFTQEEALEAYEALWLSELATYSPGLTDLHRALELARRTGISVYDASYVALAETLECSFVTADRKLARKLRRVAVGCEVRTV